ncbi:RIMS-binding protein 2 [Fragariocoptes setiger]|uniref:RIMS-binding protein 2 n=1 Tax=Fragariocoptes setiger TaxID=1670756 RepID=A0ABQ7S6G7_9ACAR|nr:RIMS-binding protein 2 [Fragariocoptes setiger]
MSPNPSHLADDDDDIELIFRKSFYADKGYSSTTSNTPSASQYHRQQQQQQPPQYPAKSSTLSSMNHKSWSYELGDDDEYHHHEPSRYGASSRLSSGQTTSTAAAAAPAAAKQSTSASVTSRQLDDLMARLEQDNKILAELDRMITERRELKTATDNSCSGTDPFGIRHQQQQQSSSLKSASQNYLASSTTDSYSNAIANHTQHNNNNNNSALDFHSSLPSLQDYPATTATSSTVGIPARKSMLSTASITNNQYTNAPSKSSLIDRNVGANLRAGTFSLNLNFDDTTATRAASAASYMKPLSSYVQPYSCLQQQQHQQQQQQQQSAINTTSNLIGRATTSSSLGQQQQQQQQQQQLLQQQLFDEMRQIEDTVDSIDIPGRGRCKVYISRYEYDPFKQSPNENPDSELALSAGDFIMVFDDIDEDGYFIGEQLDGRRGYVPSNWLEKLSGEDLFEFQASVLYGQRGGTGELNDEDDGASYPPEFYDAILSDTICHTNFQHLLAPDDFHRMNDYVDLDDVVEIDDEYVSDFERADAEQNKRAVAPPQRLMLERQLNKSILIAWLHPNAAKGTIVSYQIYVDGVLKSTVPSGDRTKALLEGVDSSIPHRISVRAIDQNGRHSNDAGCTIVIGKNVPFAPSCVKASHITSDSALISWLPCNSNFHHVVAVNSVEVQTLRPGVYKHMISGLSANTLYRVSVRAKPGKLLAIDEKNPKKLEMLTTYVDFKTVPKSLPDAPVNVQVEAGPQQKTLLVTWLPLTLNNFGTSNGCPVTGYAVFAGHKKLADIDSPTGDHALLDLTDLECLHKKSVTVRTKSGENLSQDSMPCQIPDEYLKTSPKKVDSHHRTVKQGPAVSSNKSGGHVIRSSSATRNNKYHGGARSNPNFESDDSRSSIPAIEITKEAPTGADALNQQQQLESYSEEEFEQSMRVKTKAAQRSATRSSSAHRASHQAAVSSSGGSKPSSTHRRSKALSANKVRQMHPQQAARQLQREGVRYFVALFDYDPSSMSPNPDAAAEELAFKEGSIIKVYGDKGADGFYRGELNGRIGFVPCNVVSEIQDPATLSSYLMDKSGAIGGGQQFMITNDGTQPQTAVNNLRPPVKAPQSTSGRQRLQRAAMMEDLWRVDQNNVKCMVAMYDYDPQEHSPNADTEAEISFRAGDIIYVYGLMDTDGFYIGELERTKERGLVPSNFLEERLPPPAEMVAQQQQRQQRYDMMQVQQPTMGQMGQAPQQQSHVSLQQQIYLQRSINSNSNMNMNMMRPATQLMDQSIEQSRGDVGDYSLYQQQHQLQPQQQLQQSSGQVQQGNRMLQQAQTNMAANNGLISKQQQLMSLPTGKQQTVLNSLNNDTGNQSMRTGMRHQLHQSYPATSSQA